MEKHLKFVSFTLSQAIIFNRMNRWVCLPLFLIPLFLYGQKSLQLGLNVTPLVMNTLEARGELVLSQNVSLQGAAGVRAHKRNESALIQVQALQGYVQERNQAAFVSLGGKLFNSEDNPYEVPFIGLALTMGYYRDEILESEPVPGPPVRRVSEGFQLGVSANIGFSIRLNSRLNMDLAMQMGYSPPRKDLLQYYSPGVGYSTYGPGVLGVRGGHLQPQITLKYIVVKDKRQRIWEME